MGMQKPPIDQINNEDSHSVDYVLPRSFLVQPGPLFEWYCLVIPQHVSENTCEWIGLTLSTLEQRVDTKSTPPNAWTVLLLAHNAKSDDPQTPRFPLQYTSASFMPFWLSILSQKLKFTPVKNVEGLSIFFQGTVSSQGMECLVFLFGLCKVDDGPIRRLVLVFRSQRVHLLSCFPTRVLSCRSRSQSCRQRQMWPGGVRSV